MVDFSALIQRIEAAVYENGVQAITGQILQDCLKDVVNTVNVQKQDSIYRITVTVDGTTGTPSGTARMDDETYTLELSFSGLKGETGPQGPQGPKGDTGETGPAGVSSASVEVDSTTGTPSATASVSDGVLTIHFSGLKGETGPQGPQGNTGSSVDYPYELVNNLTTNDATKGLSAAQGMKLDSKISQLGQEVDELEDVKNGTINTTKSTNLLNPAACVSGYINVNTGEVGSYSGRYASDYIPVSENGLYCNAYNGYGVVGGNAVYDAQKRFLRGFSSAAYTYQSGDAYVRWTLDKTKVETPTAYCIEGTSTGSYTPYFDPIYSIKMEALPDYISQVPELINDVGDFEPTKEDIIISNWVNGGLTSGAVIGYQANNTRLIGTCRVSAGEKFNFECQSGWSLSIRLLANELFDPATTVSGIVVSTDVLLATNGWATSGVLVAPEGTKSAVILMRRDTNANIAVSEASNASFWTFTDETITEAIKNIKEEIKTEEPMGYYAGEKISLGEQFPFRFNLWKSFGLTSYAQSLAIHGDYIVFFRTSANASLWRISSGEKIADLVFSYGQNSAPHGNVLCFGNEFYPGNTVLPLLYLSQWDGDGGCLVYNVDLQGNTTLVQVINASGIDADTYGSSLGDWVIDNADNSIYSVKYHLNDSLPSSAGNYDNICKFELPKLSDGDNVILTQADVKGHFSLPYTPILQDKKISQGRLFMAAGNRSYPGSQKIFVVDLYRKGIIATFDVYPLGRDGGDEPEGLALIEEGLVLGLGYEPTSFYLITTF